VEQQCLNSETRIVTEVIKGNAEYHQKKHMS
jgi:hypothetical protein